jgi:hypothetical protein
MLENARNGLVPLGVDAQLIETLGNPIWMAPMP